MPPTSRPVNARALIAVAAAGCGSFNHPDAPNTVVPEGSEWVAPANGLRLRHYDIAEVDTIIGFVRGVRTRSDGAGTLADELTVEIYRDGTTNRQVKRVTVHTHRVRRRGAGLASEDLGATVPSPDARRDAEELLADLGCPQAQTEQRMTLEGPVFQAWCSDEPGAGGAEHGATERQSGTATGRLASPPSSAIRHTPYAAAAHA